MKTETAQTPPAISHSPKTVRRASRQERRAHMHNADPKRNDGKFIGTGNRQMMQVWNSQAIYAPKHKKLKGYEKEARRNSKSRAS